MKRIKVIFVILSLASMFFPVMGKEEFKQVQQWNHGNKDLYTILYGPVINNDGHIIIRAGKQMKSIYITPKEVVEFGFLGQGPSDIFFPTSACNYFEDIAYFEMTSKIKIFTKKDNNYTWKETKSLKCPITPMCKNMLFNNDKWFIAGVITQSWDSSKNLNSYYLLYAFDNKGERIKGLFDRQSKGVEGQAAMDYFLALHKNHIIFMVENQLKVFEIDADRIELLKERMLQTPDFYVKMPPGFYVLQDFHKGGKESFGSDCEKWKTSYSIITNIAIDNDYLAIQVRTCSDKLKKYALLFYNSNTLNLEKTFFSDDFFIGARNGTYYFYANGNPGYDEKADECIINLYSFVVKN